VTALGVLWGFSAGLVGFLVALGADGPEVTSALLAVSRGSADVGLGVVLGSNLYNLAGLLGLAAIVSGGVATRPYRVTLDGGTNAVLTVCAVGLVMVGVARVPFALVSIGVLTGYVILVSLGPQRVLHAVRRDRWVERALPDETPEAPARVGSWQGTVALAVVAAIFIVVGSDVLVQASLTLAPRFDVPASIEGTFVLAIATSLPNSWATVSLARRGHSAAAIAATFNSNSINVAIGAGLPSLFVGLRAGHATVVLDAPWLLLMTAVALILVSTRWTVTRVEGSVLVALYGVFVVVRLVVFG
jgi:cation:H+ antiporter